MKSHTAPWIDKAEPHSVKSRIAFVSRQSTMGIETACSKKNQIMDGLTASGDTGEFEVPAEFDEYGGLTRRCADELSGIFDEAGFVICTGFLSDKECGDGLSIIKGVASEQNRERARFASQTDIRFRRRDFCPLPCDDVVLNFSALVAQRGQRMISEYCGRRRSILEISTLTSYLGSSHQYLHRDPPGVLCIFAALNDVSAEQGGTVFVPGTHGYSGSGNQLEGKSERLMGVFQNRCNQKILAYNLRSINRMRRNRMPEISGDEYWARVFSSGEKDNHQPNIYRFLSGRNPVFGLRHYGPRPLVKALLYRKAAAETYRLVQTAPSKGSLIFYRSDVLHAGPDNRSAKPRYFFNINIARDMVHPRRWRDGYAPHSTLLQNPQSLGDLLDRTIVAAR